MAQLPYPPYQLYHSGSIHAATSSPTETFTTLDPCTSHPLAIIHTAAPADIDAAVRSAQDALPGWSATSPVSRARILAAAVRLLRARNDDIARLETRDTGKPFAETKIVDVPGGADVLEFYANLVGGGAGLGAECVRLGDDKWVFESREAVGVCGGIGAWNYPIQIALWKSAPCLAAGNTMVYKPSEVTPLHGLVLAEIYTEAGLPPGVFNIVNGGPAVGSYLVAHPAIAKVSFTGQVSTGQKVASSAASNMKYVTMELGGKSPLIVLPDADLEIAVNGAMMANFFSSGQVCTNGTRVFVPKSRKEEFEKRLLEKMKHIRPGDPMDLNTNFGPLVSKTQYEKVLGYIKHGIDSDKANLLYGGPEKPKPIPGFEDGYWIQPTVFTDCIDSMKIVQEEIFGPVVAILTYDTIEEVITRSNNTPLGLAAGVFTSDLNLAHKVVAKLEAGITWVNTWGENPAEMSVGGWKQSGMGVENGKRGLEAWLRTKSTLIDMSGHVPSVFSEVSNIS